MGFITTDDDVQIFLKDWGPKDAQPIVFHHGWPLSSDDWDHILDGGRSVIDAYAFPMIRWAKQLLPDGLTGYPNVQALRDRIAADTAVQKVLAREADK